jgi:hypothetical protein
MGAGELDEGLLVAVSSGDEQSLQAAGGVGHGPPSSVQGDARWAPTTPPIATYWMPSGPGTIRRCWAGATRAIVPGFSSNVWSSANSVADPASGM